MKNQTKLLLFSTVLFVSCTKSDTMAVPEPVIVEPAEPIVQEPIRFTVTETKEPFALINDKGFEALLIVLNVDTDNQINGKVSEEDILKVRDLQHILNGGSNLKAEFIKQKYGEMPKISQFEDISHLINLRSLGVHGGKNIDLSGNTNLEEINWKGGLGFETLNLSNLDKLKIVQCYAPMMPHGTGDPGEVLLKNNRSLEVFEYYGHAGSIDFSQTPNLRSLKFSSWAYADSVLNLLNTEHLEEVRIGITNRKGIKVLVSPKTMDKIRNSPSNFHIPETAIWTVRG